MFAIVVLHMQCLKLFKDMEGEMLPIMVLCTRKEYSIIPGLLLSRYCHSVQKVAKNKSTFYLLIGMHHGDD